MIPIPLSALLSKLHSYAVILSSVLTAAPILSNTVHTLAKKGNMSLRLILFCFHFTISAGFRFLPVGENATVGTPFTLTWHREPSESQEFRFERRNSSQQSGEGDPISFTPPDNGTTDGTVTVNFPSPGQYTIELLVDNDVGTSLGILASNSAAGTDPSPTTTFASSTTATVSTPLVNTSSIAATSSSSALGSLPSTSTASRFSSLPQNPSMCVTHPSHCNSPTQTSESGSIAGSASITTGTLPSSYRISNAGNAASPTSSESPLSSSSSSNPNVTSSATSSGSLSETPKIVGATVGSFVFLLLLLGALVYTLLRRQHRRKYRVTFHCDRMVRKRSNASFSPLTPTAKDSNTYTNFTDIEKRASGSSIETEDTATGSEPKKEYSEYSLPAPPGNRSETPSPVLAHTDRQMELYDVLVKQKTEMIRLKTELRRGGDAQEEIDALKGRITGLEEALKSPWALGYTDDVPVEVSRALVLM